MLIALKGTYFCILFVWLLVSFCFTDLEDKGAVTVSLRDKRTLSKDADPEKEHQVIQDIIPNLKDFIVAYSTVPSK